MIYYIIYFIELIQEFCKGKTDKIYEQVCYVESKYPYYLDDPEDYHYHPFEF